MKKILTVILCIGFMSNVGAESIPTKEDKEDLIGTYIFKGDYKKSRNLVVELTISLDNAGQLVGHHRYKKQKTKGKWYYSIFTNFRRLSAREWTREWKILTIPGERCDKDRHCFVADREFYYWSRSLNKYTKHHEIWNRLSQFSLDYQEVQNYSMIEKGHGGGMSSPYYRVAESEALDFVWCAIGNTLTHTTKGLCTTFEGKIFATRAQAETETNTKWKGSLPQQEQNAAVTSAC
jgi:hypothetical protein